MKTAAMLIVPFLAGCVSSPPPVDKPAITSFSDNHVIIRSQDWPGPMANSYCERLGKSEVLVSRANGDYHFACLAPEYTSPEDSGYRI